MASPGRAARVGFSEAPPRRRDRPRGRSALLSPPLATRMTELSRYGNFPPEAAMLPWRGHPFGTGFRAPQPEWARLRHPPDRGSIRLGSLCDGRRVRFLVPGVLPLSPPTGRRRGATNAARRSGARRSRRGSRLCPLLQGPQNDRGECLSFCIWDSARSARAAAGRPRHVEAATIVHETYASYRLELYTVRKQAGRREFEFEPYRPRSRPTLAA